jgi:small GTP-binding protein
MHDSDPLGVEMPVLKVILVGDSGVGKTSLIAAFIRGAPDSHCSPTVTPAYVCHEVTRRDDVTVCLQIWDTAGQERFHSISALFYREADVAVVCYEAGSPVSIDGVPAWVKRVQNQVPDCDLVFVATKSDLLTEDRLPSIDHDAKRALGGFQPKGYFVTSAISGKGIEQMFLHVAELKAVRIEPIQNQAISVSLPPKPAEDGGCC